MTHTIKKESRLQKDDIYEREYFVEIQGKPAFKVHCAQGASSIVYLAQCYGREPRVKLRWAWNRQGRIAEMLIRAYRHDAKTEQSYSLTILEVTDDCYAAWTQTDAHCPHLPLPVFLNKIRQELGAQPIIKQYAKILSYGHTTARQLETALAQGTVRDVADAYERQRPLKELRNDEAFRQTLRAIAKLQPRASIKDDALRVSYEPYAEIPGGVPSRM